MLHRRGVVLSWLHQSVVQLRSFHSEISLPTKFASFIDNAFVTSTDSQQFPVVNPSTRQDVVQIDAASVSQVDHAIEAASRALPNWSSAERVMERALFLKRWAAKLELNKSDLAALITLENGKTWGEAKLEMDYAISFLDYFSRLGEKVSTHRRGRDWHRRPVGVCIAITPWNFPAAMITRKLAAGLMVGCTFVVKPSELTPITALAMVELAVDLGLPPGVVNVVPMHPGETPELVERLLRSPEARKLTFTGSARVGMKLLKIAQDQLLRVSLELGGVAPCLVCEDANITTAVREIIFNKIRSSGQTCIAVNYVLAHQSIAEELSARIAEGLGQIVVGDGFDPRSDIGPLINQNAVDKVQSHIDDAIQGGGHLLLGGKPADGNFVKPTVVTNVSRSSVLCREETFGPVVAVVPFASEDEAMKMMRSDISGLAAYIFGHEVRMLAIADQLEYGMVGVNTCKLSDASKPFGGMRRSGMGREGSIVGLDDYAEVKYVRVR